MSTATNGRYSKVSRKVWNDHRFRTLSAPPPNAQTLWVRLMTGPELTCIPGLFSIGEAGLAEAMGWPLEGFREAFREVFRKGMAKADWEARLVWLPKAPSHNKPESPNVIKSWASTWEELPECALKVAAYEGLRAFAEGWGEPFLKAFEKACPKPLANQEQEQEQDPPLPPKGVVVVVPDEEPSKVCPRPAVTPADEVYEHWLDARQAHNPKTTRIKISPKDRKALLDALARGRTVEELKLAAEGHFLSPHFTGDNDRKTAYLAFEYVLRDKNLDAFVALARAGAEPELPILRLANRADYIPNPDDPVDETTAGVGAALGIRS